MECVGVPNLDESVETHDDPFHAHKIDVVDY